MSYVSLGRLEQFPENECRVVRLPGYEPFVVINLDEEIHVLGSRASTGHSFEDMTVMPDEGKILCPSHGWEIDLCEGSCSADPNCKVTVYPVRIESGEVQIAIE
jgi:nitrite reductase/ring-hydroxylating ferredoxin subunit